MNAFSAKNQLKTNEGAPTRSRRARRGYLRGALRGLLPALAVVAVVLFSSLSVLVPAAIAQQAVAQQASTQQASTQQASTQAPAIMIIHDLSGSMWQKVDEQFKFQIARDILNDSLGAGSMAEVEVGFISYGHRRRGDCSDIELIAPPKLGNLDRIADFVNRAEPIGKTPLTTALSLAGDALSDSPGARAIVLLTDGLESCGGDPCAEAIRLRELGLDIRANVVGFDLDEQERNALECIAVETGGRLVAANSAGELRTVVSDLLAESAVPTRIVVDETEINRLKALLADLQEGLEQSQRAEAELQALLNSCQAESASLREEIARLLELNRKDAELLRVAKTENQELEVNVADRDQRIAILIARLAEQDETIKAGGQAQTDLQAQLDAANEKIADLIERLARSNREVQQLNDIIVDKGEEIVIVERQRSDVEQRAVAAEDDVEDLSGRVAELEALLAEANAAREAMTERNSRAEGQYAELDQVRGQLQRLERERDDLAARLGSSRDQIVSLRTENRQLRSDVSRLEDELANTRRQLSLRDAEIEALDRQLLDADDVVDQLRRQLAEQQSTIQELVDGLAARDDALAALRRRVVDQENTESEIVAQNRVIAGELVNAQAKIAVLEGQVDSADDGLQAAFSAAETLMSSLNQTRLNMDKPTRKVAIICENEAMSAKDIVSGMTFFVTQCE